MREHVMRLISDAATGIAARDSDRPQCDKHPTITVIGAGNCQDIDLPALAASFTEIRLIVIDHGCCVLRYSPGARTDTTRRAAETDVPVSSVRQFLFGTPSRCRAARHKSHSSLHSTLRVEPHFATVALASRPPQLCCLCSRNGALRLVRRQN